MYISTWEIADSHYYIALENPSDNADLPYTPAGEFDHATLEELEEILVSHFKII
jgi:hypothetical protein